MNTSIKPELGRGELPGFVPGYGRKGGGSA